MDIGEAVRHMEHDQTVARAGWNGKNMWIRIQKPDHGSRMTLPYVFMSTAQGDLVPWLCSQADLLAKDWELVLPKGATQGTVAPAPRLRVPPPVKGVTGMPPMPTPAPRPPMKTEGLIPTVVAPPPPDDTPQGAPV